MQSRGELQSFCRDYPAIAQAVRSGKSGRLNEIHPDLRHESGRGRSSLAQWAQNVDDMGLTQDVMTEMRNARARTVMRDNVRTDIYTGRRYTDDGQSGGGGGGQTTQFEGSLDSGSRPYSSNTVGIGAMGEGGEFPAVPYGAMAFDEDDDLMDDCFGAGMVDLGCPDFMQLMTSDLDEQLRREDQVMLRCLYAQEQVFKDVDAVWKDVDAGTNEIADKETDRVHGVNPEGAAIRGGRTNGRGRGGGGRGRSGGRGRGRGRVSGTGGAEW